MAPRYMRDDFNDAVGPYQVQGLQQQRAKQFVFEPVLVPQTTANWSSPFYRGYADILVENYDISAGRWLAFVDGLNEVLVQNAALNTVGRVSGLASWAPSVIVSSVATGVQIGAGVGDRVRSKQQVKHYLDQANDLLFRPRGLFCKIYETDKALNLLGLPPSAKANVDDVLAHARAQVSGDAQHQYSIETAFAPFGDRVQPLNLVEQQTGASYAQQGGGSSSSMMSKFNQFSVSMEQSRNDRKANKAAQKLLDAQQKGKSKDIAKQTRKYASVTGQQVGNVGGRPSLIGSLKSKLGGGSTLWLVVVALEDASLADQAGKPHAEDQRPPIPPRLRVSSQDYSSPQRYSPPSSYDYRSPQGYAPPSYAPPSDRMEKMYLS